MATNRKNSTANNTTVEAVDTVVSAASSVAVVEKEVVKREELKLDTYVPCVSMVKNGKLVYTSKRQLGYNVIWAQFGDVQYIELKELMAMRSTDVSFFVENWIVIEDSFEMKDEVLKKLHVTEMYRNAIGSEDVETLFVLPIDEMIKRIAAMTNSMRESVYLQAKEYVASENLDSIKRVKALETALGKKLI